MKKFTFVYEQIETEDGAKHRSSSSCDGFNGIELLGILDWKRDDILQQLHAKIVPDEVKRSFIVDDDEQDGGAE